MSRARFSLVGPGNPSTFSVSDAADLLTAIERRLPLHRDTVLVPSNETGMTMLLRLSLRRAATGYTATPTGEVVKL